MPEYVQTLSVLFFRNSSLNCIGFTQNARLSVSLTYIYFSNLISFILITYYLILNILDEKDINQVRSKRSQRSPVSCYSQSLWDQIGSFAPKWAKRIVLIRFSLGDERV